MAQPMLPLQSTSGAAPGRLGFVHVRYAGQGTTLAWQGARGHSLTVPGRGLVPWPRGRGGAVRPPPGRRRAELDVAHGATYGMHAEPEELARSQGRCEGARRGVLQGQARPRA
jgi:hypothetical protein